MKRFSEYTTGAWRGKARDYVDREVVITAWQPITTHMGNNVIMWITPTDTQGAETTPVLGTSVIRRQLEEINPELPVVATIRRVKNYYCLE